MITVYENRYVSIKNIYGTQNENNVTELEIQIPEQYKNWNKRIVFVTDEGNKWDLINGNIYKLKNNITKYQEVYCYIWLTKNSESEEESIDDFRSETFRLFFNKNVQADDTVPTEEQIDGFNTLINELNVALDKVNNINSDIEKLKEEVTQTIEDLNTKVETGEFDGATFIPNVDAEGNISWTNDKGLPNPSTQNIKGEKGDQGKQGEQGIPGEKGEQGNPFQIKKTYPSKEAMDLDYPNMQYNDYVMIASNVNDEDNAKLYVKAEGKTGWVFITDFSGAQGIQGEKGEKGDTGVGISRLKVIDGALYVTLTNNVKENAGVILTDEVKSWLVSQITDNAESDFNEFCNSKVNDFNSNAESKITEYNTNATNKINEYNTNAEAILKILPKTETEVLEEIDIDDAGESSFNKLSIYGNSRQKTREGTNLLDFNVTQNEKVIVNEDGTITINGTGGFTLNFKEITLQQGVNYYQKYELVSGNINSSQVFMNFSGETWLTPNNFTLANVSEETNKSGMWIHNDAVFENAVIKIWANTNQSDFEQYGMSPSPNYPSEIETIKDSITFKRIGKNYFNSEIEMGEYNIRAEKYSSTTRVRSIDSFVLQADNYTISCKNATRISFNSSSGGKENTIESDKLTITLEEEQDCVLTIETPDLLNTEIQIEKGTEATEYEPYNEDVYTLPVQQEMLTGDYIKDVEHHEWKKLIFDENSNMECIHNDKTFQFKFLKHIEGTEVTTKVICNMAKHWNMGAWEENGCFISFDGYFYILCKENEFGFNADMPTDEAITHFKTILANSKLIAYYKLATPINLELTEEQTAVLNQLEQFSLEKGINHIFSDDEISPKFKLKYYQDINILLDKINKNIADVSAQLIEGGSDV